MVASFSSPRADSASAVIGEPRAAIAAPAPARAPPIFRTSRLVTPADTSGRGPSTDIDPSSIPTDPPGSIPAVHPTVCGRELFQLHYEDCAGARRLRNRGAGSAVRGVVPESVAFPDLIPNREFSVPAPRERLLR